MCVGAKISADILMQDFVRYSIAVKEELVEPFNVSHPFDGFSE